MSSILRHIERSFEMVPLEMISLASWDSEMGHRDDTVFFLVKRLITALVLPPTGTLLVTMGGLLLLWHEPRLGQVLAWCGVLTMLALSLPPGA